MVMGLQLRFVKRGGSLLSTLLSAKSVLHKNLLSSKIGFEKAVPPYQRRKTAGVAHSEQCTKQKDTVLLCVFQAKFQPLPLQQ